MASGGEISRIILALKITLAKNLDEQKLIIFDEIDTGTSGSIAANIGTKLMQLSNGCQILCISHLPQVASMATNHFKIEKIKLENRNQTQIKKLDTEGRKIELARMLAGENITKEATAAAEKLLFN